MFEVDTVATIRELKLAVQQRLGIMVEQQRLLVLGTTVIITQKHSLQTPCRGLKCHVLASRALQSPICDSRFFRVAVLKSE